MRRALLVLFAAMMAALAQPAHAAPAAPTGAASAGMTFTTASATYHVWIDVETGFLSALPGQINLIKQIHRCDRDGTDCRIVAQEVGPLNDGETFAITTDHKARLKARWLGHPLVIVWDRYTRLPKRTGMTLVASHWNWTQHFSDFSSRFMSGSFIMLGSKTACARMTGTTVTSAAATAERASFATEPLPAPATLTDFRNTKGRCPW